MKTSTIDNVVKNNLPKNDRPQSDRRAKSFIQRQFEQVRQDGPKVLFPKIKKSINIFMSLLAVPFVLVIRLMHPFFLIRFGYLQSDRIGHFAGNTEIYLCKRDVNKNGRYSLDLFYWLEPICNNQLKKMWQHQLHVTFIARWLDHANRMIPGGEKHIIPSTDRDTKGVSVCIPSHLIFTREEERFGQEQMKKIGIPTNGNFVCFSGRDPMYLEVLFPSNNWSYHDYRDSRIQNYVPAVEELVHRGYIGVRMGAFVKDPLTTSNAKIIDYAKNYRTEFLDIYLPSKCRFVLTCTAGVAAVPRVFRKPVVTVDFISMEYIITWRPKDLFIPKKLWLRDERRFLTFREILGSKIARFNRTEYFEELGIEPIDNTPEEIKDVTLEMDERLNGIWQTTPEDEAMQKRFWSCFKPSEINGVFLSRIGTEFLRQNQELLK